MIDHLENRLGDLAAKQGAWSLTLGEPRMTFYSDELLPLWEIVEALQQTKGESYQYAEVAGPLGYFSGIFSNSQFIVVSEGKSIVAEVAATRSDLQRAAKARSTLAAPQTIESLELFFTASPFNPGHPRSSGISL